MLHLLHHILQVDKDGGNTDSWVQDISIELFGVAASLATAFLVIWYQVTRARKDRLIYVASLITSISKYVRAQARNCGLLADELKISPAKFTLMKYQASDDLNRLTDKVDQEGFYHAYLWKYGRWEGTYKQFKDIYHYLDFMKATIDQLISFVERENQGINERKKEYKKAFDATIVTLRNTTLSTSFKQAQPTTVIDLNNIFKKYTINHTDPANIPSSYEHLIVPLMSYIETYRFPPNPEITALLETVLCTDDIHKGIGFAAASFSNSMLEYQKALDEAAGNFDKATSALKRNFAIPE